MCEGADIKLRDDTRGGKREIYLTENLSAKLTNELSEARENADQKKEEMKSKIKSMVPELNSDCAIFREEIDLEKYDEEQHDMYDIDVMVQLVNDNDITCKSLV